MNQNLPGIFAYIDPAATSYIIQIVSGIVISCGVAASIFRKRIQIFFRDKKLQALEKKLTKEAEKKENQSV